MAGIKYDDNVMEYIGKLRKAGIAMEQAAAEAINKAADLVAIQYKRTLSQKVRLRNKKFTLGAIKVFKARASRSSGETRKIDDINAIVGVMNLRGEDHYLARMEEGGIKKGSKDTGGKAVIPMDTARGGDRMKPILSGFRMSTKKPIQIQDLMKRTREIKQSYYAQLYSMVDRGIIQPGIYQGPRGIYHATRKKVTMIRKSKDSVKIKSNPLFEQATYKLRETDMDKFFVYAAEKMLRKL